MKYVISALVFVLTGFWAEAAQIGRVTMSNRIVSSPHYTASVNQLSSSPKVADPIKTVGAGDNNADKPEEPQPDEEVVDMREAERNACINNNIGIGNTFVWASKYSNTSDYASMVEDVEHPENNVCFVRVELNSTNESRIKVSDIEPKYFMWGEPIVCGSWVSKKKMEDRILEARKGARIGGIVATTVAGVGLGVGAMELFGNDLIGGKVMGQKSSSVKKETLYKNELLALKKKDKVKFDEYNENLKQISEYCKDRSDDDCSLYTDLYKEINK